MTQDDIKKKWDSFIEYPEGSDKLYVTTTSALIFARVIAKQAAAAEREACAKLCDERAVLWPDEGGDPVACASDIRARGQQ